MPKSSFEKTIISRSLYITSLRRYWPGAALMFVVYIIGALAMANDISNGRYRDNYIASAMFIESAPSILFGLLAAAAGLVASMLCFHYLMNHREAVMTHSLPLRRETLLLTAAASGLTLLCAPIVAGGVIFFTVFASFGYNFIGQALLWVYVNLAVAILAFAISAFVAMLTGNSIAHGVLTLIFVNLPLMVEIVFMNYCNRFLFGFITWDPVTYKINPIYQVVTYLTDTARQLQKGNVPDLLAPAIYLLIAAISLQLAALVYRRRRIESAGDVIAIRQVRPFLRYGAALGFAAMFGAIYQISGYNYSKAVIYELLFSILGGAFGFFTAEMFIRRTVRVFKRYFLGAIGFSIAFTAVFLALVFDLPGYGRMKLDAGETELITILGINGRVRNSLLGEPLDFYGTLSDLDIDDPGGYLTDREYRFDPFRPGAPYNDFIPDGSVPPDIARQIIEQDVSVMRGGDAAAAVAFQNLIADNSRNFSQYALFGKYGEDHFRSAIYVPFIVKYKDGKIIQRRYNVYLPADSQESLRTGSAEEAFYKGLAEMQRLNVEAIRKYNINCAARANRLRLLFYVPIADGFNFWTDNYPGVSYDKENGDTNSVTLLPGEWDGLFEAYFQDIPYADKPIEFIADSPVSIVKNRYSNLLVANAELVMPDGYSTHVEFYLTDINTLNWLINKGMIKADILETYKFAG